MAVSCIARYTYGIAELLIIGEYSPLVPFWITQSAYSTWISTCNKRAENLAEDLASARGSRPHMLFFCRRGEGVNLKLRHWIKGNIPTLQLNSSVLANPEVIPYLPGLVDTVFWKVELYTVYISVVSNTVSTGPVRQYRGKLGLASKSSRPRGQGGSDRSDEAQSHMAIHFLRCTF